MFQGIIALVLASVGFGMLPVQTKLLLAQGMENTAITAWRFVLSALLVFLYLRASGKSLKLTRRQGKAVFLLGMLGYLATSILLTSSYLYLPSGAATMLHFSYPILVTIAGAVFFREKFTWKTAVSVAMTAAGLALMGSQCLQAGSNAVGILLALLSGLAYAVYVISLNRSVMRELDSACLAFYVIALCSVSLIGVSWIQNGQLLLPTRGIHFLLLVSLSGFCTVAPLILLSYGIRRVGETCAAMINLLEPVISLAAGWILLREAVSLLSAIGSVLVLLSITVNIFCRKNC